MTAPAEGVPNDPTGRGGQDGTRHLTSLSSDASTGLSTGPATASGLPPRRTIPGRRSRVRAPRSGGGSLAVSTTRQRSDGIPFGRVSDDGGDETVRLARSVPWRV